MSNSAAIKIEDVGINTLTIEQENFMLKETVAHLQKEVERFKRAPYLVSTIVDVIKPEEVVIRLTNGSDFYVHVSDKLAGKLKPNDRVIVEQKSLTVIDILGTTKHFDVSNYVIIEKPTTDYTSIGGLEHQINEIQEVVDLPLLKPELFKEVGIEPPKGILLYGPPGTGKTLLAKAAAKNAKATFIEIVGSELVQKFIGEGTKFVKSIFDLAKEKSPAIIFIDEIDAIAAKRIEIGTSGEREVQRTFMQLLAELDGFRPLGNVKVIGATNRLDILDPAITRPGRLDRLIEVSLPNKEGRESIFKIHTKNMNLAKNISLKKLAELTEKMSGAEIKAVCTESGYFAIRADKKQVNMDDFLKAIDKVWGKKKEYVGNRQMYG